MPYRHITEIGWLGIFGHCRACGAPVSDYNCTEALIALRPAADGWDWWTACDNTRCHNHDGEGLFQNQPIWSFRD